LAQQLGHVTIEARAEQVLAKVKAKPAAIFSP
jgi:hypothetical protein